MLIKPLQCSDVLRYIEIVERQTWNGAAENSLFDWFRWFSEDEFKFRGSHTIACDCDALYACFRFINNYQMESIIDGAIRSSFEFIFFNQHFN